VLGPKTSARRYRPQGYRLHLDTEAVNALHESLPRAHYELFEATSMQPVDSTTLFDTSLRELRRRAASRRRRFNEADRSTMYGGTEHGYTGYPTLDALPLVRAKHPILRCDRAFGFRVCRERQMRAGFGPRANADVLARK
jgi:hypothetical protein